MHGALVGVPATIVELETNVDNGLVIQEPAAENPVASHIARKVGADVPYGAAVVEIREVGPVANSRFL